VVNLFSICPVYSKEEQPFLLFPISERTLE
jgi:hypothetical protein